jgi:hypothetical protein
VQTLQWMARGGLQLVVLLTVAAVPGGSVLLLFPRVRRVAFGSGSQALTREPLPAERSIASIN